MMDYPIIKISKELSCYSFQDVETFVISNVLKKAGIKAVKNKLIKSIIERNINQGITFWFDSRLIVPDIELLEGLYELNVNEEDRKVNGSYYTPTGVVSYIVQETVRDLGTVCDPACGSGAFLIEASKFLNKKFNLSFKEIFKKYIYGVDILPNSVLRTKIILSLLAITSGEDNDFEFNIFEGDSLDFNWKKHIPSFSGFNYIIGNPPYVRTKNLRFSVRQNIKKWETANFGNVDLYIPFFELAVDITHSAGIIGFITPNTYLTSSNAQLVREFIFKNKYLEKIVDFNGWQIFEGAITYTCITILNKKGADEIKFSLVDKKEKIKELSKLKFDNLNHFLLGKKEWRFLSKKDAENIFRIENSGSPLFKYVDKFITGLATLNNDLFLVNDNNDNKYLLKEYNGKTYQIERDFTKKIIKPNKVKDLETLKNNKERIIYPYEYGNKGRAKILPESHIKSRFPKTYDYLCAIKNELDLRDKGLKKYEAWYAYGRTQGLNGFGKKIILPMMGNRPSFVVVEEEETLFYCGYAIYPKKQEDFRILEKVLNSDLMWFYIKKTSKNYSGGFKSFAKNYVKNFSIPSFSLEEKRKLLALGEKNEINKFLSEKYQLVN